MVINMAGSNSLGKKTAPEVIIAKEKAAKALALRRQGYGFREIYEMNIGYNSIQAAHNAVKRAMDEIIREPVEELRNLELDRLDINYLKMKEISEKAEQKGDFDKVIAATNTMLKIQDRRAKYAGLDKAGQGFTDKDGNDLIIVPNMTFVAVAAKVQE
jgi:hypothetical protein